MTLRARLGVAALLVVGVLLGAGLLLPQTVRASAVAQVDRQSAASLPLAVALSSGAPTPAGGVGERAKALAYSQRSASNRSGQRGS